MSAGPEISVVVPTCNRVGSLGRLIGALAAQQGVERYETLIVDDCSTDGTWEELQRLSGGSRFPLRRIRTPARSGPAAARNLGWRAARAPLVAFTDDDCAPEPAWLARLMAALRDADIAQGSTVADPVAALGRGPFARLLVIDEFSWKFETCNIGYRRELLDALGGFDERYFPPPFGEDVDLGWRALGVQASTTWAPEATVVHEVHTSGNRVEDWIDYLRYLQRCEYAAAIVKRHPGLRAHLTLRIFYKSYHALTLAAAAGVVLTGRSPRWAAATLPWLWHRLYVEPRPARRRWLWAVLAMTFAADATEVACTLKGAIRERTLLL